MDKIIKAYARDYCDMAMSEETLTLVLTEFLNECLKEVFEEVCTSEGL